MTKMGVTGEQRFIRVTYRSGSGRDR